MIFELDVTFSETEKNILIDFGDIDIKLFVRSDTLLYSGVRNGEEAEPIKNPRRMIMVGGLYLLELKDEPEEWYMGELNTDSIYWFWGNYGDLQTALKNL